MSAPGPKSDARFYEIIVEAEIDASWASWFDGLRIEPLPNGQTRISGCLADQAALRGTLDRIFDFNMPLVSITSKPFAS